ncbi:MAG: hypothetical protein ACI915_001967 [Gammaproteobacteria bacterium]|jgi:hypothetical protein
MQLAVLAHPKTALLAEPEFLRTLVAKTQRRATCDKRLASFDQKKVSIAKLITRA